MKIITLIENSKKDDGFICEHGLCIYIETAQHKLLLDTGASDAFIENAKRLDVDLSQIDTVILSHGHYDHTGGLLSFLKINAIADIYMQESAIYDFYHHDKYIGIDKRILNCSRLHLLNGSYQIDNELIVFSNIKGRKYWPQSNRELTRMNNNIVIQDDFSHEQCLAVSCEGKSILLSGCAHNGILNILEEYENLNHRMPDLVVSGFHMKKKTTYSDEEIEVIEATARKLNILNTIFYTGHCTGEFAYKVMHNIMGDKLKRMSSGEEIKI